MKYLEYKIVQEVSIDRFDTAINGMLSQGWEPHGSLIILPRHDQEIADGLFQAMVRIQRD